MITDEELADRLGRRATQPVPIRPLGEIRDRARLIRRAGRARRAGALTVIAGGLGVGVVAVRGLSAEPGGGGGSATPGVSATPTAAMTDCNTGYAEAKRFADAADLLHLPSVSVAGGPPLKPALVRRERATCAPARLQGYWYALSGGVVTTAIQVSGPDARDPYDLGPGGTFSGSTTVVRVRGGSRGVQYSLDAGPQQSQMLSWREPDGSTWWAEGSGLDRDSFLIVIDNLRISDGRLTPRPLPGLGLPFAVQAKRSEYATQVGWSFRAMFGSLNEEQGGWSLTVRRGAGPDVPVPGARPVTVNGRTAWWSGESTVKRIGWLTWTDGNGLRFEIRGAIDEAKALAVARSLTHVSPDDPRLLAAREDPDAATSSTATAGTASPSGTGPTTGPAGGDPTRVTATASVP